MIFHMRVEHKCARETSMLWAGENNFKVGKRRRQMTHLKIDRKRRRPCHAPPARRYGRHSPDLLCAGWETHFMVRQRCQGTDSAKMKKVMARRGQGGKNAYQPITISIKSRALDMEKQRQAS